VLHDVAGATIGAVTSGGFGPSVNGAIAMGYVDTEHAAIGTAVFARVRERSVPLTVSRTPFFPQRYYRG
jgi:aminomethyltransferase